MSISGFFKDIELGAEKVIGFIVKEMTNAENLLGAKTGSAKLNIVITAVESALSVLGIPVGTVQNELKAVVDALVALLNKAGIFPTGTPPTPAA